MGRGARNVQKCAFCAPLRFFNCFLKFFPVFEEKWEKKGY